MSAKNRVNMNQSYVLKIRDLERTVAELEYGVSEAKRLAEENLKLMQVRDLAEREIFFTFSPFLCGSKTSISILLLQTLQKFPLV